MESGHGVVGNNGNAEGMGTRLERRDSGVGRARGEVEPEAFAIAQAGQADPVQNGRFVAVQIQDDGGWRTVKEIEPALASLALDGEAPYAMTGQTGERRFCIGERKTEHVYQPLLSTGQVPAQTKEPLTVLAEGIQTRHDRPSVRPQELVALVMDALVLTVSGRITAEKNS